MSGQRNRVALITGVTGQDGSYLAELLLSKGYEVHGLLRRTSNLSRSRIAHIETGPAEYRRSFYLHYSDLSDATTLRRIFQKIKPSEVYHLAGQSHVGLSFDIPESTCEEVAMSTLRLLEICRDQSHEIRIFHASTSEVFGRAASSPQTEETPFRPSSPYGCAKAFATQTATVYRDAHGLFVCNGIMYNHESPRRGQNFVTRKISRQAAKIKLGLDDKIALGNTKARRDWGHAVDYVKAMWMMLQYDRADDYVVATGRTHSVQEFLELAFGVVGLRWQKYLVEDSSLGRMLDPACLVGDPSKIKKALGWTPTISFEDLVREMVENDLQLLSDQPSGVPRQS